MLTIKWDATLTCGCVVDLTAREYETLVYTSGAGDVPHMCCPKRSTHGVRPVVSLMQRVNWPPDEAVDGTPRPW